MKFLVFILSAFLLWAFFFPEKAVRLLPVEKQDKVFVELSSDRF